VAAIALLVISSLTNAAAQPRTIIGWEMEHFLGYFAATLIVCLAWPRPWVVAGILVVVSGLLEGLQAFTPTRHPNLVAALCGAGGALAAALLVEILKRARGLLQARRDRKAI
jgi:VanZ family protein